MKIVVAPSLLAATLALVACNPGSAVHKQPPAKNPGDNKPTPVIPLDTVHVIGFGDSVTKGYCASPGWSYFDLLVKNDDDAYPDAAGHDLSSFFGTVTTNNQGQNGAASCDFSDAAITGALGADANAGDPTVLVVTLGGNDLIHDYSCAAPHECGEYCASLADATTWAQNYKDRMVGFIQAAQAKLTGGSFIFLATIYDPTDGVGDIENASLPLPHWAEGLDVLDLYNQTINDVAAATGAHVVDMHGAMLGHGIHYNDTTAAHYDAADPTYWYCENLEDPNDHGYNAIRHAFWTSIASTLNLE